MEMQLLKEPEVFPSKEILKNALDDVFPVFEEIENMFVNGELALIFDWKYYKDSKAWLCKVSCKKKTIFWLSVWNGFIKTSFFFLQRHLQGISALEINKNGFKFEKEFGKMIPLVMNIDKKEQLNDLLKIAEYKNEQS